MITRTLEPKIDGRYNADYNGETRRELMEPWVFLRSITLFQDLDPATLRWLADQATRTRFSPGDFIFHQGDPGVSCHIIERGRVRIFVVAEDGREFSLQLLGAGEIIGEMAILEELPRSASVEALEDTWTYELHRETLVRCVQCSPALALRLLRVLSARLRNTTYDAEGLASLTVSERLMRRLEHLGRWTGRAVPGGVRITLPMTQQALATLVGTSRESVNRALVRLQNQGRIRMEEGWIILLDPVFSVATYDSDLDDR